MTLSMLRLFNFHFLSYAFIKLAVFKKISLTKIVRKRKIEFYFRVQERKWRPAWHVLKPRTPGHPGTPENSGTSWNTGTTEKSPVDRTKFDGVVLFSYYRPCKL